MLQSYIRWGIAIAVMVVVMAGELSAQRLLETDGIELRGTVADRDLRGEPMQRPGGVPYEGGVRADQGESWPAAGCLETGFLRLQRVGEMVGSSDRTV